MTRHVGARAWTEPPPRTRVLARPAGAHGPGSLNPGSAGKAAAVRSLANCRPLLSAPGRSGYPGTVSRETPERRVLAKVRSNWCALSEKRPPPCGGLRPIQGHRICCSRRGILATALARAFTMTETDAARNAQELSYRGAIISTQRHGEHRGTEVSIIQDDLCYRHAAARPSQRRAPMRRSTSRMARCCWPRPPRTRFAGSLRASRSRESGARAARWSTPYPLRIRAVREKARRACAGPPANCGARGICDPVVVHARA
jgi:hypothetical protein